jgi:glycosyltransferase involved in cell wall biosynthesis
VDRPSTATTPAQPVLGVIIPAYNEERSIELIIRRVLKQAPVKQVVVVDDCSSDGTLAAARRCTDDPRVTVKHHDVNMGKGAAIRTALESVTTELVIIQDADLEYDPADYEHLVSPILRGRADVVFGIRGFAGHSAYSYWFVIGNRLVTTATNILFNCYIQDMETGFKVMRTSLMRRLGLRGNRFDIEPEITGRILRLGYRIYEVPIDYAARTRLQGKKLTWLDGVKALFVLLRIRLTTSTSLFGKPDPYHEERLTQLGLSLMPGADEPRTREFS